MKNAKTARKYNVKTVTWRIVSGQMRYSADKRTALNGKVWWCIFDHKIGKYIAGNKYKTRAECMMMIGRKVRQRELPTDVSDFLENPHGFKKGKHTFVVDVFWTVARSYEVKAKSREEAAKIMQSRVDKGEICVWNSGFEATDDVKINTSGEEKFDGSIMFY